MPVTIGSPIDPYYFSKSGDIGLVKIDGPYWLQQVRPIVYVKSSRFTRLDPSYDIRGVEGNLQGKSACMTGKVTGTRCGEIKDTNEKVVVGNYIVRNLARVHVCTWAKGDSGGPVYKGHLAYGTIVSGRGCAVYIQSARLAENLMHVDILTRR